MISLSVQSNIYHLEKINGLSLMMSSNLPMIDPLGNQTTSYKNDLDTLSWAQWHRKSSKLTCLTTDSSILQWFSQAWITRWSPDQWTTPEASPMQTVRPYSIYSAVLRLLQLLQHLSPLLWLLNASSKQQVSPFSIMWSQTSKFRLGITQWDKQRHQGRQGAQRKFRIEGRKARVKRIISIKLLTLLQSRYQSLLQCR